MSTIHYGVYYRPDGTEKSLCGRSGVKVMQTLHYLTCLRCLQILRSRAEVDCRVSKFRYEQESKRLERIEQVIKRETDKNRQSSVDTRPRPLA